MPLSLGSKHLRFSHCFRASEITDPKPAVAEAWGEVGACQGHRNYLCRQRIGRRLCWFPGEVSRVQEAGLQNCPFIQTQMANSDLWKARSIITQTPEGQLHIHCPFSPEHRFLRTTC